MNDHLFVEFIMIVVSRACFCALLVWNLESVGECVDGVEGGWKRGRLALELVGDACGDKGTLRLGSVSCIARCCLCRLDWVEWAREGVVLGGAVRGLVCLVLGNADRGRATLALRPIGTMQGTKRPRLGLPLHRGSMRRSQSIR